MNILAFGNGSLSVAAQERKLAVEWAKKGHKVYLLHNESYKLFDRGDLPKHKNLILIDLPFTEYKFELLQIEDKIDVCFGFDQSVCPFVAEYKRKTNIKSFCMFLDFPVHVIDGKDAFNYNFGYSQRYYWWINCGLEIDGFIFNNSIAVDEFYKRYKRKADLVFYAISNDSALDGLTAKPTKDFVVGCHRLINYKGTAYTFQALKRLNYDYAHLYVSGEDKEIENVKALASSFTSQVRFLEKVDENDKMQIIYNAKLIVYPQVTEWIGGLSILEGWSVLTPGVCFDYPVLRELYGDCVLYARPRSVIDLREKIKTLYEDKDLNKELAQKGYDRFHKMFTRKVMAENLLKVFND